MCSSSGSRSRSTSRSRSRSTSSSSRSSSSSSSTSTSTSTSSVVVVVYLSVCLSASLKTNLFCVTSSILDLGNIKKRSNSARHPQFLTLTMSQRKQFCETSSIFQVDNRKKTKQFCETSFKNWNLRAQVTASYQCVLRFFHSICLNYCACHEKVTPGHAKCCTCHA